MKKTISFVNPNFQQGPREFNAYFLPYSAGVILSYVMGFEHIRKAWSARVRGGLRLHLYSSGSVPAQKLLFGNTVDGDLTGLFQGFFDTRVGSKRESESYDRICIGINVPPAEVLFLSDIEAELDAAASAGLRTCQLVRPQDGTVASDRHAVAADFPQVGKLFQL